MSNRFLFQGDCHRWKEWICEAPVLMVFAFHFFPPAPAAIFNVCFVLSIVWACCCLRNQCPISLPGDMRVLLGFWVCVVILFGVSIIGLPSEMREISVHNYWTWIGKGTLFGAVLLVYVRSEVRARNLLITGALAAAAILLHHLCSLSWVLYQTGSYQNQRDYLYWLLPFFPFALACFAHEKRWRELGALVAVAMVFMAITTGYRGAMLALIGMTLLFASFGNFRKLLLIALALAFIGVLILLVKFPDHGHYVLAKLHKTDSTLRFSGLWLPAFDMARESPWLGHGFGYNVFAQHYLQGVPAHPQWTVLPATEVNGVPFLSPHSMTFEILFALGFPGLLLLAMIFAVLLRRFWLAWRARGVLIKNPVFLLHTVAVVAVLGNFGLLAQTESPSWRTLPIFLAIIVATAGFSSKEKTDEIRARN